MKYAFRRFVKKIIFRNYTHVYWSKSEHGNWGDDLNPILCEKISGKPSRFSSGEDSEKYMCIGSILSKADSRTEVWGAGFMQKDERIRSVPSRVYALRGPLSARRLNTLGVATPDVYGDPALLISKYAPEFARNDSDRRFRVGVIPHYVDQGNPLLSYYRQDPACTVIDIRDGIWNVIEQVNNCEIVYSSSLHGLVCADAYGIPNVWVEFSSNVSGSGFKFRDYFLGAERTVPTPHSIKGAEDVHVNEDRVANGKVGVSIEKLLAACPFYIES